MARSPVGFLALPKELRDKIYCLAVVDSTKIQSLNYTRYSFHPKARHNGCFCYTPEAFKILRLTNRQVHNEVQDAFFENNTFSMTVNLDQNIHKHKQRAGCECDFAMSQIGKLILRIGSVDLSTFVDLEITRSGKKEDEQCFKTSIQATVKRHLDVDRVSGYVRMAIGQVLEAHLESSTTFSYAMVDRLRMRLRKVLQDVMLKGLVARG